MVSRATRFCGFTRKCLALGVVENFFMGKGMKFIHHRAPHLSSSQASSWSTIAFWALKIESRMLWAWRTIRLPHIPLLPSARECLRAGLSVLRKPQAAAATVARRLRKLCTGGGIPSPVIRALLGVRKARCWLSPPFRCALRAHPLCSVASAAQ